MKLDEIPLRPSSDPDAPWWAGTLDVPCPDCGRGLLRWAEAGNVPGWRRCDECGSEWQARDGRLVRVPA